MSNGNDAKPKTWQWWIEKVLMPIVVAILSGYILLLASHVIKTPSWLLSVSTTTPPVDTWEDATPEGSNGDAITDPVTVTPTYEMKAVVVEYIAVDGDTLVGISREYMNVDKYADAIGRANCIGTLKIDDKVTIKYYIVQGGDYLNRIAERFEVSVQTIQFINGFDGETIYPGQVLILPIYEYCE